MSTATLVANLQSAIAKSDASLIRLKANWYSNFHTVKQLRKLASEAKIKGRSKMRKAELCMALAKAWA